MATAVLEPQTTKIMERQVVALHLAEEVYGLDIAAIHTVITPQTITTVPKAPAFVKGVINLRGRILPVIDLRTRFGLPPQSEAQARRARIVIVEADGVSAGLIVDAVSEVLRLPESAIDAPSQLIASAEAECITGIGRIPVGRRSGEVKDTKANGETLGPEERLIILLDVTTILARDLATMPQA